MVDSFKKNLFLNLIIIVALILLTILIVSPFVKKEIDSYQMTTPSIHVFLDESVEEFTNKLKQSDTVFTTKVYYNYSQGRKYFITEIVFSGVCETNREWKPKGVVLVRFVDMKLKKIILENGDGYGQVFPRNYD